MKKNINQFWYETDKGVIKINMTRLYRFLNSRGISLIELNKSWFVIEEKENVIEEVDETYISQLIKKHIRSLDLDRNEIDDIEESLRNKNSRIIAKDQLMLLDQLDIQLKKETKDTCFIYYQNEWMEVKANGISNYSYSQLDKHVWRNKILQRDFTLSDLNRFELIEQSAFAKFIWNVCNQNEERFESLCSMIGYMIHEYQDPSKNKAIIFMDEKISDNPEGGTGKGIVINALSNC